MAKGRDDVKRARTATTRAASTARRSRGVTPATPPVRADRPRCVSSGRGVARPWLRLRLRVPEDAAESLGVACIERGASGAVTGQRDLRRERTAGARRAAPTTRFEAYFPPGKARAGLEASLRDAVARLREVHPRLDPAAVRLEPFPLPDIGLLLRGHFPPVAVGRRLLVCPPWAKRAEIEAAGGRGRIVLRIEPAQAFGTGHHATTRGCLVAIERATLRAGAPGGPRSGLDVGSGSGVLALAMRKLGVRRVAAVDDDPVAREATRKSFADNDGGAVSIGAGLGAVRGRFDLVVANLFAGLLVELAPLLRARTAPGGRLIVSGLLARQEAEVRRALVAAGFRVARRTSRATWVTLELDAPGAHPPGPTR
ncbi:MAG: 50S ribosomal protein L11 methyltransferase [Alphaproteobacteria bacterium]